MEGDVEWGIEREEIREERDCGVWLYVYLGDMVGWCWSRMLGTVIYM